MIEIKVVAGANEGASTVALIIERALRGVGFETVTNSDEGSAHVAARSVEAQARILNTIRDRPISISCVQAVRRPSDG